MKKRSMKVTVSLLGVAAMVVAIYLAYGPTPTWACPPCECRAGTLCVDPGTCVNDFVCACAQDCSICGWIRGCPPKPAAQPHASVKTPKNPSMLVTRTTSRDPRQ